MPDRTIPLPDPRFRPYSGPPARTRGADGSIFYACLGSIGDDKTTFFVHVWMEKGGLVMPVPVIDPPNDEASFSIEGGQLLLTGARNKILVERVIPGFVEPSAVDTRARYYTNEAREDIAQIGEAVKAFAEAMP